MITLAILYLFVYVCLIPIFVLGIFNNMGESLKSLRFNRKTAIIVALIPIIAGLLYFIYQEVFSSSSDKNKIVEFANNIIIKGGSNTIINHYYYAYDSSTVCVYNGTVINGDNVGGNKITKNYYTKSSNKEEELSKINITNSQVGTIQYTENGDIINPPIDDNIEFKLRDLNILENGEYITIISV